MYNISKDSAYIGKKMVYNIVFYPRRKTNWLLKVILGKWYHICHQEN
jgi:hypothetical protein